MTPAEINRLLAVEVMGWTVMWSLMKGMPGIWPPDSYYNSNGDFTRIVEKWSPMTDLNDVGKLLEVLRNGWRGHTVRVSIEDHKEGYLCTLSGKDMPDYGAWGKTLAEAICLAAVAVVKGEAAMSETPTLKEMEARWCVDKLDAHRPLGDVVSAIVYALRRWRQAIRVLKGSCIRRTDTYAYCYACGERFSHESAYDLSDNHTPSCPLRGT